MNQDIISQDKTEKMSFDLQKLIRPNILTLKAYSSARDEYKKSDIDATKIDEKFESAAPIFLDANENALGSPLSNMVQVDYNRYPDPHQRDIKTQLARLKNVEENQIFVGNGSDEAIDLLFRIFCTPNKDNIIICPPTYGMYAVSATINDVEIRKTLLTKDFQLDLEGIKKQIDENTKLIFVCSPNNPTGNLINKEDIRTLCSSFNGIVVVDEAYIDFAENAKEVSFTNDLAEFSNLVVLQTLSKAWGMAGVRLGMAFASAEIMEYYRRTKPPYNVNMLTQKIVSKALNLSQQVEQAIAVLNFERQKLIEQLRNREKFHFIEKVYDSSTNFILVKLKNTDKVEEVYNFLIRHNEIVVRNRSKEPLCEGCLRITIGTPEENELLLKTLERYVSVEK
ncbi:histidinol-phosphate transaminase [Bernardetia sp.]|uniref:histidinol-phosphate transaminase n=1 Tax=Bernardetia sp. TaxID=1937974 RepID=UPI0025B90C5E|nr:histidinol-phosphate transaminase [Bernardetia sp.]